MKNLIYHSNLLKMHIEGTRSPMHQPIIHRKLARLSHVELLFFDTETAGPTIVCLHGRWGRAEVWTDFIHHYGHRFRIIAPDQRGHGFSGKPIATYSAEEMAADIIELLDYLRIQSAFIVGHSMGGRIAGYLAALYPTYVTALALLDKSARGNSNLDIIPPDQIPILDPVTNDWPLPFPTLREATQFLQANTESQLEFQYFFNSLTETPEGYSMLFSTQAIAANIANDREWWPLLPQIRCPVFILRSSSHEAVSNEDLTRMRESLPDCTVYESSSPDHNVQLSNPEEFYRFFDEFVQKINY